MKWLAWIFKIGWKVVTQWVSEDIVETTWFHARSGKTRVVRKTPSSWF